MRKPNGRKVRNEAARKQPRKRSGRRITVREQTQIAAAVARRYQVLRMKLAGGVTFGEIGAQLGVSGKTAHGDYYQALREVDEQTRHMAKLELARMERLNLAVWQRATASPPDLKAVEVALRLSESRRKLLGLDAQPEIGYSEAQVVAMLRGVTSGLLQEFQDPDARRRIAVVLRKQLPAIEAPAIDEPTPPSEPQDAPTEESAEEPTS